MAESGSPEIRDDQNVEEKERGGEDASVECRERIESEEDDDEGRRDTDELEKRQVQNFVKRLSRGRVGIRVHDILIKGNEKTRDSVIEATLEDLKNVDTMQELMQAATVANTRLRNLGIFKSATITLDAGPPELPDTANVVVEVVESDRTFFGDIGVFSKPEARTWTVEGSLKSKNLLGYAETWDGTGSYGWDKTSEMSAGLFYPRLKGLPAALTTRLFLHTEDWVKYSSYKQKVFGFTVGLDTNERHNLSYSCKWRYMLDPSLTGSRPIRRQLGHYLLSSVSYSYMIDGRDSMLRPTRGFAFASKSEIAGIGWDSHLVRFARQDFRYKYLCTFLTQMPKPVVPERYVLIISPKHYVSHCIYIQRELDFRYAIPLGFYNAALNLGVSAGIVLPWGKGYRSASVPISDRFFMGGHSSLVCSLGGPTGLLGFRCRGVGPTGSRRVKMPANGTKTDGAPEVSERDALGGDVSVTAFADLSFDLPLKILQTAGVHGHFFACAGNLAVVTGDQLQPFSLREFGSKFRYSAGVGIVIPTKLARIEINYCEILRQFDHDHAKRGIQFSF